MNILKNHAFQICIVLFVTHQILQKILNYNIPFADQYLDPFLSIPIFLSLLLMERRWLLRQRDFYFSTFEVAIITCVLAIIFEEVFPRISTKFTRDNWDYVFYFLGGCYFRLFVISLNENSRLN